MPKRISKNKKELYNSKKQLINAVKRKEHFMKTNTAWDDLEDAYQNIASLIVVSGETIQQSFHDQSVFKYLLKEEIPQINTAIQGMSRDLIHFSNKLKEIHDLHADKSGNMANENEIETVFNIFNQYTALNVDFQTVVTPNHKYLLGILDKVLERRAQDPDVITDVEIKEPETETKEVETVNE